MTAPKCSSPPWARLALLGIVVYLAVDVVLAMLRPDLSLLRDAESDYGNGPYRWLMDVNFEVRLLLSAAVAVAAARAWRIGPSGRAGLVLLVVWSAASGLLGFFPDDVEGAAATTHGMVHLLTAAVGFTACLLGTGLLTLAARRLLPPSPPVLVLGTLWVLAAVGLVLLAATGFRPNTLDGLWERVFLAAELLWMTVVCWPSIRHRSVAPDSNSAAPQDDQIATSP